MENPVLSIGLIFRDDIRCIERCLKALQPLRDSLPCELVMADTGSVDGSRAVVEQYADIVFDFPWINDFAAARNAVMDRCSGEWFLSVDTDEYLDDCDELVQFLRSNPKSNLARVVVRNYDTYEMDANYSDFLTLRLLRLSTGGRYEGIIHESWVGIEKAGPVMRLVKTVFRHDGYVGMSQNTKKLERNVSLLREKIRQNPKRLLTRLQMIESGYNEPDYLDQVRKGVSMVKRKAEGWQNFGPPILRHAVIVAEEKNLPEFEQWAKLAEKWFPNSYYTKIDIAVYQQLRDFTAKNYTACIARGKRLLEAYEDYFAGRGDMDGLICSTLRAASPYQLRNMEMMLANAYTEAGEPDEALAMLERVDCAPMGASHTETYLKVLMILHNRSQVHTDGLIRAIWEGINTPAATQQKTDEKQKAFFNTGVRAFTEVYQNSEKTHEAFQRHAFTLFLPLRGESILGDAAAILSSDDQAEITSLLAGLESWVELPVSAFSHALLMGIRFPLAQKQFMLEELDGLASRLAQNRETLNTILRRTVSEDFAGSWQVLAWVRALALALAAVQSFDWTNEKDGLSLARIFAEVEQAFITGYYSQEMLREGNLCVLPAMHRFGWYCAQAFAFLEAGDAASYVRLLRDGLASCESMKPMVEFLLEHTPELQTPPPSPELLELAEKVRAMLAAYSPDDPAVTALKASPVYQRVAHLVEAAALPAV